MRSRDSQSPHQIDDGRYTGPERRSNDALATVAPVRLTHKYAEAINGIDLSRRGVGDHLHLPPAEARLLIAEGWAEPDGRRSSDLIRAGAERRPLTPKRRA